MTNTTKHPIVSKKVLVPFILITSLFALWGIANDLTNPIVQGSILDIGGSGFNDAKILGYIPEVNFSFILPLICLAVVAFFGLKTWKNENQ